MKEKPKTITLGGKGFMNNGTVYIAIDSNIINLLKLKEHTNNEHCKYLIQYYIDYLETAEFKKV